MRDYLIIWLAVINVFAFILMGADKLRAKRKGFRRLPEKSAFIMAAIGGSAGVWLAMLLFRHKTKHWYFMVFIPMILLAQGVLLWLVWPIIS